MPKRTLHPLLAGGLLIALALSSFGLSFIRLGEFALPLALLIAVAKGAIVVLVFMRLGHETPSVQLAALAAVLMLLLLAGLMSADAFTREPSPVLSAPIAEKRAAMAAGLPEPGRSNQANGGEEAPAAR